MLCSVSHVAPSLCCACVVQRKAARVAAAEAVVTRANKQQVAFSLNYLVSRVELQHEERWVEASLTADCCLLTAACLTSQENATGR